MSNAKKILFVGTGQFCTVFISFFMLSFLSRRLSEHDNGSYFQTILYNDLFVIFFGFGLSTTIYLILSTAEVPLEKSISNIIKIVIFFGIIGCLLSIFSSQFISTFLKNKDIRELLRIYSINIPIFLLATIINLINIYLGSVQHSTIITGVIAICKGLGLVLLHFTDNLTLSNIFICLILCNLLFLTVNWVILGTYKLNLTQPFDKKFVFSVLKQAFPMAITSILGFSYTLFAGTLISYVLMPKDYAIYRNGAIELPFISTITGAVTIVYLPILSKLIASKNFTEVIVIKRKLISLIASITYPIITLLIFLAPYLIPILLSHKYVNSIPIFVIFTAILYLRITDYQDVLVSAGEAKQVLYSNVLFVVSNLVFIIIGVKFLGVVGAAIGVLCSVLILAVYLIFRTTKYLEIKPIEFIDYYTLIKIIFISVALFLPLIFISSLIVKFAYASFAILLVYYLINRFKIVELFQEVKKIISR